MRIIASIEDPQVIETILQRLEGKAAAQSPSPATGVCGSTYRPLATSIIATGAPVHSFAVRAPSVGMTAPTQCGLQRG